jgi:hypothetical protein
MRMQRLRLGVVLVLGLALAASSAEADTPQQCISLWSALARTNQTQGVDQQQFMAACLAHKIAAAPAASGASDGAPAGATGRCRDGAYTAAAVPLAGCDRHGGLVALVRP